MKTQKENREEKTVNLSENQIEYKLLIDPTKLYQDNINDILSLVITKKWNTVREEKIADINLLEKSRKTRKRAKRHIGDIYKIKNAKEALECVKATINPDD